MCLVCAVLCLVCPEIVFVNTLFFLHLCWCLLILLPAANNLIIIKKQKHLITFNLHLGALGTRLWPLPSTFWNLGKNLYFCTSWCYSYLLSVWLILWSYLFRVFLIAKVMTAKEKSLVTCLKLIMKNGTKGIFQNVSLWIALTKTKVIGWNVPAGIVVHLIGS